MADELAAESQPPERAIQPEARAQNSPVSAPAPVAIWASLGLLYVLWGSTYPAIKVAVRTIPPFFMASVRYLIGGLALLGLARLRGENGRGLTRREWKGAFIVGGSMALIGNGGVAWAKCFAE